MQKRRTLVSGTFFVFFLLANPAYFVACAEGEKASFSFDDGDMLALVEELNNSIWLIDGYEIEVVLNKEKMELTRQWLSKPGVFATANACGSRSFIATADACVDVTFMSLNGVVIVHQMNGDGTMEKVDEVAVSGEMEVTGLDLTNAWVELSLPDGHLKFDWHERDGDAFQLKSMVANNLGDEETSIDFPASN